MGDSPAPDPRAYTFGQGRRYASLLLMVMIIANRNQCRVCPGQTIADNSLWLEMALSLTLFDIEKPLDASGKPYDPPAGYTPGLIRCMTIILVD